MKDFVVGKEKTIKAKSDATEETRDYWKFLEENSKEVNSWPEWKKGK